MENFFFWFQDKVMLDRDYLKQSNTMQKLSLLFVKTSQWKENSHNIKRVCQAAITRINCPNCFCSKTVNYVFTTCTTATLIYQYTCKISSKLFSSPVFSWDFATSAAMKSSSSWFNRRIFSSLLSGIVCFLCVISLHRNWNV